MGEDKAGGSAAVPVRGNFDVLSLAEIGSIDRFALETLCRAQVCPVYLGDHTAICRILGRYKFYVDTRDRGFGSNLLLDGFWEMWLTTFIARRVKPGMAAVDVGANFGYYTLLLADLVGAAGRVHAIEPNPDTAAVLRHSVMLNGFAQRTHVIEAAAGKATGELLLYAPRGEPKNASIIAAAAQLRPEDGTIYRVRQITLDEIAAESGRIDFVKIDAEGAEEAIICGALDTLRRDRPALVLEFNAARCKAAHDLLGRLKAVYGNIQYVDFSGAAADIDEARLATDRFGEDWLLFFDAAR